MALSEKTIDIYNRMYKLYKGIKPTNLLNVLLNEKKLSHGYIKSIASALLYHTKNKKYKDVIKKCNDILNETNKKHTNRFKKINVYDIKLNKDADELDKVIHGLYTLFPPRRLEDYTEMLISYNNKNDNYNYCNLKKKKFIFNIYKTRKAYGQQVFDIPDKLFKILKEYTENNKDVLIDDNRLVPLTTRALRSRLYKIFGVSVDGIRHSFITKTYQDNKQLYNIEDTAKKMGHSVNTHLRYLDKDNNQ